MPYSLGLPTFKLHYNEVALNEVSSRKKKVCSGNNAIFKIVKGRKIFDKLQNLFNSNQAEEDT